MTTKDNMPQTTKERSKEDVFHFFCQDVKDVVQERGDAFIREMAAWLWERMKPEERCVYKEEARNKEQNLPQLEFKNKRRPRRRYCTRNERVLKRTETQMRMNQ
jgi:hypothetical protein